MPDNETTKSFMGSSKKVEWVMRMSFILALILNFVLSDESTVEYYTALI